MKKIFAVAMMLLVAVSSMNAQDQKQILKERHEIAKLSKKELNSRATKSARKAAKTYVKEGWKVAPGALPLEKQLDRAYGMQYEYDDNAYPRYIMAEAMSIGENYDAAKMQALELAKQTLQVKYRPKLRRSSRAASLTSSSVTKRLLHSPRLFLRARTSYHRASAV